MVQTQAPGKSCSREWPCNHCQARRIAHLCKFTPKKVLKAKPVCNDPRAIDVSLSDNGQSLTEAPGSVVSGIATGDDFRMLGYLPDSDDQLANGAEQSQSAALSPSQGLVSPELEKAIRTIPPKPYTDTLVQYFLSEMNDQYYCLYPPTFSHDYATWWSGKANGQSLTPAFTALLLHVCACAVLYLDVETRQQLESDLGENYASLSEQYHRTAKQLSNAIGPGKGGLTQVQQLFLGAIWYKTEALFVESWHALGAAIHEAQELGMHRSSSKAKVSEFEREMRRRIWCLLYTWDWQMSLLLSRPFIINSSCCSLELPNLRLETPNTEANTPSPVTSISLQCQLGQRISTIPGVMSGILLPNQAIAIQQEVTRWTETFPPIFHLTAPDTTYDHTHTYIPMQRHQLHALAHMVTFMPLKPCLTINPTTHTPNLEKSLQPTAVSCALNLMLSAQQLLSHLLPANGKFHFAPFLMFDTAAYLCSALIHDKHRDLPQRDKVLECISLALSTLKDVARTAKTGATCYAVLAKIVGNIPLSAQEREVIWAQRSPATTSTTDIIDDAGRSSSDDNITSQQDNGMVSSVPGGLGSSGITPDMHASAGGLGLDGIPSMDLDLDLSDLNQIWDWDNLGLDLDISGF
ncbi:transcriptional regulator family: Fungal Specific TF [Aspergillus niger]|nr:transcriptional regulator family: Fungal Specific TF [Aspergillus niger]KAI2832605.1 transcriptional regulator family: Fungal Specific TF [Aspergillus niger]KAI2859214.1 transcriptional regulator family: Fungal Specific TF [Aspergillus niger]KAI2881752.1 transcriptional regulator family: Fungal Specific TF [Aspergillus niger]KAI2897040.1 transcriptional regulator family: Fungal Specific TF [Aspergillus niger]